MSNISEYIKINLDKTIRVNKKDGDDGLIGLPYPYTVPSVAETNFFQEMYYWDTYFTCKGLEILNRWELIKNNTDNILYMVDRYGHMPNGTRECLFGRSQPPVLSLMVRDVYDHYKDKEWLKEAYKTVEKEYNFWMTERITETGLNRFSGNVDVKEYANLFRERVQAVPEELDDETISSHCIALCESGWDMNPRMGFESFNYVSPELNSLLFMFEENMAYFSEELEKGESKVWLERAEKRRELMNKYLVKDGLFLDYNFKTEKLNSIYSCASLYTLFAGVATEEQAKAMVNALDRIEFEYGLSACEKHDIDGRYQWHYPNGWAPLHYIAVMGLDRYGYTEDAKRIAKKYVTLAESVFEKTGHLWEKYNVVNGSTEVIDGNNGCTMPAMIGWTAGAYLTLHDYLNR